MLINNIQITLYINVQQFLSLILFFAKKTLNPPPEKSYLGVFHKPRRQILGLFWPLLPRLYRQFYYIDLFSKVDILQTPFPQPCLRSLWKTPYAFSPTLSPKLICLKFCCGLKSFRETRKSSHNLSKFSDLLHNEIKIVCMFFPIKYGSM